MTRGKLVMVDTNVLLAATNKVRPDHQASKRTFSRALEEGIHLATCGQILREYLVVATRPAEVNGLGMKLSDALKNMIWFRKRLVYIEEPEAVHHRLTALLESAGITGKRIHDANIVALMQHSGIHTLLTNNPGDFSPFHGIETMTPGEFS